MARPANANPDETRRRCVQSAIALFARDGFHGASTRDLAAGGSVNVATITYYFGGKQGLYGAAVDEVYGRLNARVGDAFQGAAVDDLEQLAGRVYQAARAERDGVRLLVREVLDGGRLRPETEAKHFLPSLGAVAGLAASTLGCAPAQARAAIVALGYLVSRYVIQDDASLKIAYGVRSSAEAHAQVVATLATTARALFTPRPHKGARS